jgi:acyl carrier protein
LAGYLAGRVKARLILTGRSDFPAREVWSQWLSSHNERDPVSLKIRKLQKIEELGGEVLVFSADAADLQQMKEVIAAAEKRYGPINGVIHSAGLPGGGLIQPRSREMTDHILAPKVKGTLILDHLLKDKKLDFFILCSSLNSVLPQLGQVDYCAANAFMDAFAHYKTSAAGQFTLSVNWDAWQEVGMAVEAVKKLWPTKDFQTPHSEDVAHPLFDYRVVENPDRVVYVTYFNVNKHWVLDEHRIMGKATLPGTAYLEMVRAAFADYTGTEFIEIQEMFFLTPLMVEDQEEKEVHTIIKKQENNFEIRFRSKVKAGEDKWVEHARGRVVLPESRELKKQEIKIIEERCNKNEITVTEEMMKFGNDTNSLMPHFGPRWYNLKRIRFGANQVLVELELPGVFANDSRFYKLHPALMDNALGAYSDQKTHQNSEATLPFSYKRLRINAPLPQKIYSYIKSAGENQERKRILKFNITITDEEGRELVEIEEYNRLSVSQHAKARISDDSYVLHHEPTSANHLQKNHPLESGIFPTEGIKVFNRILGSKVPQVLVSTSDLLSRWEQNNLSDEAGIIGDLGLVEPTGRRRPRPQLSTPFVAPRNESEQTLARIWKEFLGLEQVGIHDDFFEMGGDSLKVVTITSKIHKALEVDIPLAEFFNNSTIRGLTGYIHGSGTVGYSSIEPAEKKEYYVLASPQTRLYLINQLDETSIAYNLPEAMLVRGKDFGKKKVEDIFKELIKRHQSLRTAFVSVEGTPMQKIHEEVEFELEYHETDAEEAKKLVENFIKPFNLGKAPLFRAGLIKIVEDQYILIIDMHHIISDGISLNIIESEFMIRNRGEELPVLSITYKDYAEWQNSETQKKFSKGKEAYWLKQFAGEIPTLNLPRDYPRPAKRSFKGNEVNFELNREETDALKKLALDEGATLFIVLLALFNVLLSKICSQEDIIVGSPTAGRFHSDLQHIVGMFVNMLALRNYPSGEKTFKEFLREVKENTLQAFNNQEYQFDDLVEKIGIDRGLNRNPLFDVVLELKNWSKDLSTGDDESALKVTPYNFERGAANFDMYWSTSEIKGKVAFRLIYCTDQFEKTRIERFFEFFREILLPVKNNNQIKLKDIKISHALGTATANIPEADFVF